MVQVPSNLIPTRVTELPEPEVYVPDGFLIYTQGGRSYKIHPQTLISLLDAVTSIDASGGSTGLTFAGGPVTTAGVLTLGGVLGVASGGTNATDAPTARSNLAAAKSDSNSDITSLSGVTGGISSPDFVQLDTTAAASIALGKLRWKLDTGTVAFGIVDGTQEVDVGQQMYALVHNAQGATLTRGQAVYLYQATGNKASVRLASNTGDPTSAKTLGLVAQTIAAGQNGFVMTQGVLDQINTSAFNEGDTLYLGSSPGTLTATKPVAPDHLVYIGVVERANAGNGQIYVKPQNGYELGEIHDVRITAEADGDLLQYHAAGPYWRNNAPGSVSVGAAANTGITDDTSTVAVVYPTWVTANTGNLPQKVSSTKFRFNPSTGVLTATGGLGGGVF